MYGLMRSVFSQWYFIQRTPFPRLLSLAYTHPILIQRCASEESNFFSVVNQKVNVTGVGVKMKCESNQDPMWWRWAGGGLY